MHVGESGNETSIQSSSGEILVYSCKVLLHVKCLLVYHF